MKQIEILATAPLIPGVMQTLDDTYVVHRLWEAPDRAALLAEHGSRIRGIATNGSVGAGDKLRKTFIAGNIFTSALDGIPGVRAQL